MLVFHPISSVESDGMRPITQFGGIFKIPTLFLHAIVHHTIPSSFRKAVAQNGNVTLFASKLNPRTQRVKSKFTSLDGYLSQYFRLFAMYHSILVAEALGNRVVHIHVIRIPFARQKALRLASAGSTLPRLG